MKPSEPARRPRVSADRTEATYDYAIIRVVPRVERGETINAGVILSCPDHDFLEARISLDRARLLTLDPQADADAIERHLATFAAIAQGGEAAGPMADTPQRGRFHYLVSPRSTVIQVSPVHTGRTSDPGAALARLVATLVE
jgi:hypothetical protein